METNSRLHNFQRQEKRGTLMVFIRAASPSQGGMRRVFLAVETVWGGTHVLEMYTSIGHGGIPANCSSCSTVTLPKEGGA